MNKRNQGIPKTNLHNQIIKYRWDTVDHVIAQMTEDLYITGYEMICDEVNRATLRSIDQSCITDIMELL